MYLPAHFREDDLPRLHALMRERPLATLVTTGAGGLLANHIPCLIYPDEGPFGTLRAHLARANPQVAALTDGVECLAIFTGEEAYVSPGWYPSKREHGRVVPTWNYIAVHAHGTPRIVDDSRWLRRLVDDLTDWHEARQPAPWRVADAPDEFIAQMIDAIVGLEIPVLRLKGKWKLSQNRSAADRAGVAQGLRAAGRAAFARMILPDFGSED